MGKPFLRNNGLGEIWNVLGEKIVCKVQGKETFWRFAVVEETSPPNGVVPPHFHNTTDEIIYILEGEYEFQINRKTMIARQGDIVIIPRKTPHGFRNLLDTSSKMLAIITPSGFENFFAEVSKLRRPTAEKIAEIGRRHDLEFVV